MILAGDLGSGPSSLELAFDLLQPKFAQLIWVPGNHELWTRPNSEIRGVAHYEALVALCRARGVLTPEDPYAVWTGAGGPVVLAPMFLLYDYSFRPSEIPDDEVLEWARAGGIVANDERLLDPRPHPSRRAWCRARLDYTRGRLDALDPSLETVLINHWPLRYDLVRLGRVARYSPWCGTRETEDWHRRYRARAVVTGHLHTRATDWKGGTRFEEVSLGYPRHWRPEVGAEGYLREILPGPAAPPGGEAPPRWHR